MMPIVFFKSRVRADITNIRAHFSWRIDSLRSARTSHRKGTSVSAISQAAIPEALLLRSIFPDRRKIRVPDPYRRRPPNHWVSAQIFAGHVAATAFMFLSLVTFAWVVALVLVLLQSFNLFSPDTLQVFGFLESILIRLDAAACCIVLLLAAGRRAAAMSGVGDTLRSPDCR
jgi:hypothetical protein